MRVILARRRRYTNVFIHDNDGQMLSTPMDNDSHDLELITCGPL